MHNIDDGKIDQVRSNGKRVYVRVYAWECAICKNKKEDINSDGRQT